MIKKITLFFIFFCMIASCGKKGDPKYEGQEKNVKMRNIIIFKT